MRDNCRAIEIGTGSSGSRFGVSAPGIDTTVRIGRTEVRFLGGPVGCLTMLLVSVLLSILLTVLLNELL